MAYSAAYLAGSGRDDYSLGDLVPDSSRRARGFAVWAALRELGRSGVADLVERSCALATRMADRLAAGGATIADEVVLNQVLVGFGDLSRTDEIVAEVQRDGTCWLGATTWHDRRLIRVSVSNATTTEARHRPLRRRDPGGGGAGGRNTRLTGCPDRSASLQRSRTVRNDTEPAARGGQIRVESRVAP